MTKVYNVIELVSTTLGSNFSSVMFFFVSTNIVHRYVAWSAIKVLYIVNKISTTFISMELNLISEWPTEINNKYLFVVFCVFCHCWMCCFWMSPMSPSWPITTLGITLSARQLTRMAVALDAVTVHFRIIVRFHPAKLAVKPCLDIWQWSMGYF